MKSLKELGFGESVYLIEEADLPFELGSADVDPKFVEVNFSSQENQIKKESSIVTKESQLNRLAEEVVSKLKREKISILRWDESDQVIYLKMDWGVLGTIRIATSAQAKGSNHPYKYNLILSATAGGVTVNQGNVREFYQATEVTHLLNSIEIEREEKLLKYGRVNYQKYTLENQKKIKENKIVSQRFRLV